MNMYVTNLPDFATEQEIRALFALYGIVESVYLVKDAHSGMTKGAAYVMMPSDTEAEQAIAHLDGTEYLGKIVHVTQADSADFPTGDYW